MVGPVQNGGDIPPIIPNLDVENSENSSNSSGSNAALLSDTISNSGPANNSIVILVASNPQITKPSLFSYMQTVSLASVLNKSNTYDISATINRVTSTFYRDMIFNADNLLKVLFSLLSLQTETDQIINQINSNINAQNDKINTFNANVDNDTQQTTNINNAANTFNDAFELFEQQTEDFNNGVISPEQYAIDQFVFEQAQTTYNDAVAAYNLYRNERNPEINEFNQSVEDYNAQVVLDNIALDVVNQERIALGLPPLPPLLPIDSTGTILPPASTFPPGPVPVPDVVINEPVSNIPTYPAPTQDLVNTVFIPLFQLRMAVVGQTQKGLEQIANIRLFADFFLQQKSSVFALPPSFTSEMATSNTSVGGTNSNAGLAAISGALDPVIAERMFNEGARNASYAEVTAALTPGTFEATLLATAELLAGASITNASLLIRLLRDSLKGMAARYGTDEASVDKALALGIVRNILDFVSKSVLSQALLDFINPLERNNPAFKLAQKALSETMDLSSIGVALGLLSSQLGLPGLGAQIMGLAGVSQGEIFNLTSNGVSFDDLMSNPFARPFLAGQLAEQIASLVGAANGLSPSEIQKLEFNLKNSISGAASNTSRFAGPEEFFKNLGESLANNGVTGALAVDVLSTTSVAYFEPAFSSRVDFRNDLQQALLSQGFSESEALQIASAIAGVSPTATADQPLSVGNIDANLLAGNLAYNMQSGGLTTPSDIATQVVSAALANTEEIAEATLRDGLIHELKVQGLEDEYARRVVAGTAIPVSTTDNPLNSPVATQQLTQAALHEELVAAFMGVYSPLLSNQQAREQSVQLADLLVGPPNANIKEIKEEADPLSLVNVIHDKLNELRNLDDKTYFDRSMENFRDYLRPNVDLLAYFERLMDPGRRLIELDNIMNAPAPATGPIQMGETNPFLNTAV